MFGEPGWGGFRLAGRATELDGRAQSADAVLLLDHGTRLGMRSLHSLVDRQHRASGEAGLQKRHAERRAVPLGKGRGELGDQVRAVLDAVTVRQEAHVGREVRAGDLSA